MLPKPILYSKNTLNNQNLISENFSNLLNKQFIMLYFSFLFYYSVFNHFCSFIRIELKFRGFILCIFNSNAKINNFEADEFKYELITLFSSI